MLVWKVQGGRSRADGLVLQMITTQLSERNKNRSSNQSINAGYGFQSTDGQDKPVVLNWIGFQFVFVKGPDLNLASDLLGPIRGQF